jgi:lysyl-tRNA synthetase class 1
LRWQLGTEHNEKPWDTYFGPMGSGTRENGEIVYFPDVRQADAGILDHWKERARAVKSPILRGRYNDLVWDMAKLLSGERRQVEFARSAIHAYLVTAAQAGRDLYDAFPDAKRALALAIQIDDKARRDAARGALLDLHRRGMAAFQMWWEVYDALEEQPKAGMTDAERDALITDLEAVLARDSDTSDPGKFDPHSVESAANRLMAHYRRKGQATEIQRLNLSIARAFEHFGKLGDPMLASMVFHTSMDAFHAAGMEADAHRILSLIEKSNEESIAQMTRHEHRVEIPQETVEQFMEQVIAETKDETFSRLAGEFLIRRADIEASLSNTAKTSPLAAMISRTKLKGNRIVANIGSIDDAPMGRLVDEANSHLLFNTAWLGIAMTRAKERHSISGDNIAEFANRTGLFGDGRLLRAGLSAWAADDFIKAAHILVPQVEAGFRTLAGRGGRPTTKPHPQMKQARMVVTFGDMLVEETAATLGKLGRDIVLHLRALYADPRGHNFRNDLSHGLAAFESIDAGIMLWVVHSLLLLGAWLKPIEPAPDGQGGGGAS